jgi:long-chain acyl-CoA synthetase
MADTDTPGVAGMAASDPEKVALVWGDRRIPYGTLDARVNRLARVLRARGVGPDAPVATVLGNRPEWIEVALASARVGARLVPASWRSTTDELDYLVRDSGAVLLVSEPNARAQDLGPTLHVGDEYERALDEQSDAPIPEASTPDLVAVRVYTSGTTGRPKAIVRPTTAGPWTHGARPNTSLLAFWGLTSADEVNLTSLPLHHGASHGYALQALASGQTVVLMERFDAETLLRLIEAERVTHMNMVPTQFVRIAALAPDVCARYDLSSMKRVLHGSAPCPIPAKQAMFDLFGPIIWETYGGMEGLATIGSPEDWLAHPGTVGRAATALGIEVVILGDDGNEVPAGVPGLVYMRPPNGQRFEYDGAPESTSSAWRDDLFTVGDVGYLDEEGLLFLIDRQKDVVITGGVNVYPAEVERVLVEHPAVSEAAVIGVPDDEWGESVVGVVVTSAPVSGDELIEHCRDKLATFKCPRSIEFVDELEVDPLGKVSKRALRDRYQRETQRQS